MSIYVTIQSHSYDCGYRPIEWYAPAVQEKASLVLSSDNWGISRIGFAKRTLHTDKIFVRVYAVGYFDTEPPSPQAAIRRFAAEIEKELIV